MNSIRNRLEDGFTRMGFLICRWRIPVLVLMLLLTALPVSRIPDLTVDTSTEGFLHKEDPALEIYERFRDQFGRDEMIIVALKPQKVFDLDFLGRLRALHRDLEDNLPYLEEVTSLINARNTRGEGDELIVEDLFEHWPETEGELATIRERALGNEIYRNLILSEDLEFTAMVIQTRGVAGEDPTVSGDGSGQGMTADDIGDDFSDAGPADKGPDASATGREFSDADFADVIDTDVMDTGNEAPPLLTAENVQKNRVGTGGYLTDAQNSHIIRKVEEITARHDLGNTQVLIGGSPVVTDFLKRTMLRDMKTFMKVVVLTIALFLLIMFRRISGILLPLFIVVLTLLSTLGFMAIFNTPLKLPTQILPSFLLAVGVGASVHILVIFFQEFNQTGKKKDAIAHALGHSGLAVLMTSLTTAGGLASFSTAAVAPIGDLGRFAALGVMVSLIYTLVLLPALISLIPLKPRQTKENNRTPSSLSGRLLSRIADISVHHPHRVLGISALVLVIAVIGALRIHVSHNVLKWLPEDNQARMANELIDQELRGSTSLEVIVDTGRENGFYDPSALRRLDEAARKFEGRQTPEVYVGKAFSLATVLKETNQALHANDPAYYTLPRDRDLVAQELFLFENSGSDDLEDFTDSGFSKARFTLKMPFIDAIAYTEFIDTVEAHFRAVFPEADVRMTGMVSLFTRVITAAIYSMAKSYAYAVGIISLLMILLIGRIKTGLLSMIPNLAPIIVMLGIMGWAGIPMDLFCMLVGSIAIGLAVDDTIHFMHNFRRYYDETGCPETAVRNTLDTTGRAMLVTTCVLSIGFFTFMFASMNNLFNFGLLTGLTIAMALLADYFIAPALMMVFHPPRRL